jgi:hypothetical protein
MRVGLRKVFAMVAHRVSMPNAVLRRAVDPQDSPDPRVRQLVAALRDLPVTPPPRPHFRAELRAQLVAVTPRLVNEGMEGLVRTAPATGPARRAEREPGRRRPRVRLGLAARAATASLVVAVLLLSGAVWLSRGALPGDALYGLKRAGEDARVSLASGSGKASDLLAFARTRAEEVAELLSIPSASGAGPQADAGISARTAGLVTSTLGSADDDVRQASVLLGTQAAHSASAAPLSIMIDWAPGQQTRLRRIVAHLPAGALHERAAQSATLVDQAYARARALARDVGCDCLASSGSDQLGPLPCASCRSRSVSPGSGTTAPGTGTAPVPAQPGQVSPPRHRRSTSAVPPGGSGSGSGRGQSVTPGGSPPRTGQPGLTPPPVQLPTLPLPGLPLPTPKTSTPPPGAQTSCSPGVTVGPIDLGTCGVQVRI